MAEIEPASLHDRIRDVLLTDWDPSDASRFEAARGEYDSYLSPLADLIRSRGGVDAIIHFLHERELESMCFPPLSTRHLERVAKKLAELI